MAEFHGGMAVETPRLLRDDQGVRKKDQAKREKTARREQTREGVHANI